MTTEKDGDDFLFDVNAADVCPIDADFDVAVGHVRRLSTKLDQSGLLYLYARYKIVTDGPCNTAKPGFFDFRARQKWEAWKSLGNLNTDTAKSEYISYVNDNLGSFILDKNDDVTTNDDESSSSWKRKGGTGGLGLSISKFVFDDDADMKQDSDSPADCLLNSVKIDNVDLCKFHLVQDSNLLTEAIDEQRMTSLHWAADRCSMNVLRLFFEEFVEVAMKIIDAQDADGQTALHYASSCDHVDVVRLLLQHGANAALCDNDGNSPFDVAVSEEVKNLF